MYRYQNCISDRREFQGPSWKGYRKKPAVEFGLHSDVSAARSGKAAQLYPESPGGNKPDRGAARKMKLCAADGAVSLGVCGETHNICDRKKYLKLAPGRCAAGGAGWNHVEA